MHRLILVPARYCKYCTLMSPINTVKLMNFQTYFHLKQELLFVL